MWRCTGKRMTSIVSIPLGVQTEPQGGGVIHGEQWGEGTKWRAMGEGTKWRAMGDRALNGEQWERALNGEQWGIGH